MCDCCYREISYIDVVHDNNCCGTFKGEEIKFCPMCGRNLATDNEVDDGK